MPAVGVERRATRLVYLLRHGETVGGVRYRGWTDDPLSPEGRAQMRRAVEALGEIDHVITSPLRRCADFARALATERGLALAVEPGFRELFFGLWEGKTPHELMARDRVSLERFRADPSEFPPPGGETLGDFRARVVGAWRARLAAVEGRRLLCVVHGGTVRVILGYERRLSIRELLRLEVPHASVHRLSPAAEGALARAAGAR